LHSVIGTHDGRVPIPVPGRCPGSFNTQETKVIRLFSFVLAALLGAALQPPARAAEDSPDRLVRETANEVLQVIRTTKDRQTLRALAEKIVLPHFDFRAMTQLAVGKHWREATPAQQKALEMAFRELLINTYTAALNIAAIGQEEVEVKPTNVKPGDRDVMVRTVVRAPNRQPVPVDYRMLRRPEGWKVYDVVVENLSLVTNYRNMFSSEIARSGIDGLIKSLEAKNREFAQSS
jgi:phospholipid transport system substrate-binding protein